jgi:sugar lactone lactonase YvrE
MNIVHKLSNLAAGELSTIAGVTVQDGIPAKEADAGWPLGMVRRRSDGELIVVDYHAHCIWRIDDEGILHRLAGNGVPGNSGDGGPAADARFFHPHDLNQDAHGNLFLSDLGNDAIRRIDAETGVITCVAGSGKRGRGGDGGPAVEAELDCTCGVAIDKEGNVYLSSEWMNNIRRVDAKTGIIETVFGHIARHYPSEQGESRPFAGPGLSLMGYHGDGGPASQAGFYHPEHLAFDSKEDLYVCDNSNDRIRKIEMKSKTVTTVLGNGQRASNGDGGPAVEASTLMPDALCFDANDNLYVGEKYGFRVRKVDAATGIVSTLVGDGVPGFGEEGLHGSQTSCNSCEAGIYADPDGTVFWGDCSGRARRYDGQTGMVTTVLGGTSVHDGETADHAFLSGPGGLSVAPDGRIYIADTWNQRIRCIDPASGIIETVAGNGARAYGGDDGPATEAYLGNPYDVSVDSRGRVVIADTRHGHVRRIEEDGTIRGLAGAVFLWDKGDGGPANCACLIAVQSVAHDADDNIYIGDAGAGRIRRVDRSTGVIDTVAGTGTVGYNGDGGDARAARLGGPQSICFDGEGNMYFADAICHVVRRVAATGIISTVAGTGVQGYSPDGTPANAAALREPYGVAISPAGQIYFSDSWNNCVRRIRKDGILETVAGSAEGGDSGDGPARSSRLNVPQGICFYGPDILLISDRYNNKIKAVRLENEHE